MCENVCDNMQVVTAVVYLCCVLSRGKNKGLENKINDVAAQRAEKHRKRDDRKRDQDQRARQLIATQKQIHAKQF